MHSFVVHMDRKTRKMYQKRDSIPASWVGEIETAALTLMVMLCLFKALNSVVNVVTDVAILALPIKPVMGLNMRTKRKLQVLCVFLSGAVYVFPSSQIYVCDD